MKTDKTTLDSTPPTPMMQDHKRNFIYFGEDLSNVVRMHIQLIFFFFTISLI